METPYSDSEHPFSNEEMRLAELLHQFLALSDDQDFAGRLIFRGPNGEYVGEAKLSARDIEAATSALESVNAYRAAEEDKQLGTVPPPAAAETLPVVEDGDISDVFSGFATLLGSEDGEL